MQLSELLASASVSAKRRGGDVKLIDLTDDSRRCREGSCFVAVRGCNADGHRHIASAISNGASAVICEDASGLSSDIACAVVASTRSAAGLLAQAMLGWPARKLTAIGVTGTNGKTTVAAMIRAILQADGRSCGLLGTVFHDTGLRRQNASNTTPGAVELAELTAEMVSAGQTHLVMEVSSHALDQDRTAGIDFDVGVFTNLSGDHLDYHGSMESYLAAKSKLFERLAPQAVAVLNHDDAASQSLAIDTPARISWYGLGDSADISARIDRSDSKGTDFTIAYDGGEIPVSTSLIGRHNVMNCLAAAGGVLALGVDAARVAEGLGALGCVPGRLQRVISDAEYQVFVDYAHTDDALENVLKAVDEIRSGGRLIVVFGCGGDRDRTKRPRMAKVAQRYADSIVITSDNPRSEDPDKIIDDILAGFSRAGRVKVMVESDRSSAIHAAIDLAESGDIVLIAGKGHEDYQIIGDKRIGFSDVEAADRALAMKGAMK